MKPQVHPTSRWHHPLRHLTLIGVMAMALLFVTTAAAQNSAALSAKSIFDVNIRSVPGLNGSAIGVLPGGEQVTAIGRNTANNWVQIERKDGTGGWVAGWLLTFSADPLILPVTTTWDTPSPGIANPTAMIAPYNINVRAEPSIDAPVVAVIPFNTEAEANARTESSSWVRVRYDGVEGWVARWLVILRADVIALPVGSGVSTFVPATVPASAAASATPRATPAAAPAAAASPTGVTATAPFRVNIRTTPSSLSGVILDVIPYNAVVPVLGRNAGNNWLQVQYGDSVGWVARWVVVTSDDPLNLPVLSDLNEISPFVGTIEGRAIAAVQLRAGPGTAFAPFNTIQPGTKFALTGRTDDKSWVRIALQGTEGWVASWVITATADISNLPVASE
ncbi:MAG: SH3 domain-containing protein [Anaerolineae bacterium]|nr:SH3 domain-containing protein [Anaerolineae bacterium]